MLSSVLKKMADDVEDSKSFLLMFVVDLMQQGSPLTDSTGNLVDSSERYEQTVHRGIWHGIY